MTTQNKKKPQLSTVKKANSKKADMFFWAVWGVSALTTFQFGMMYVSALYTPLFALLPISGDAQWLFSALSGGGSAILVLDIAYKYWSFIKLNCCETSEQFAAAASAKAVSFGLSLAYTAIALFTTAFSHLVSADMLNWIDWFGAGSFVGVCVYHLICWNTYADNAPEVRTMATLTETAGTQLSENLDFRKTLMDEALVEARAEADKYKSAIAKAMGAQWGQQMVAEFTGGMVDAPLVVEAVAENATQPPPKGIGFGSKTKNSAEGSYEKTCAKCGSGFTSERHNTRYCSDACKQAAYRERKS